MTTPIETILTRLEGVRRTGKSFAARCPAHVDKTPSLSIKEADDGRVLLYCFCGCSVESVVFALGLRFSDLFVSDGKSSRNPKIVGVSMRELKAAADFERQILYIVKVDHASGKAVSQSDWERAKLALKRISLARRIL